MKHGILVAFLTLAFVAGTAQVAFSQQAESQLQHIAEVHVKPGLIADFEAAHLTRNQRKTEAGVSFLTRAVVGESLVYRFTTPVGDWAGLAQRNSEMRELAPAPQSGPSANAAIDHVDTYLRRTRPELNYSPANPRLEGSEWGFVQRIRLHVRQGMMGEVADVIRDAAALYAQHDISEPFFVTSQALGAGGPIMEIGLLARDGADFYAQSARTEAQLGEAMQGIRSRVAALCRRIEFSNHTIRRDLAYQPPS